MGTGKLSRLRVLTLLLAFGIGLLGQVIMTAAMAMPMPMLPKQTMEASGGPSGCPACPNEKDIPNSPAMALCAATFCAGLAAILSPGPPVASAEHPAFPPMASADRTGLTVRPDLGPPRSILHT
jgi:hypothetical protein